MDVVDALDAAEGVTCLVGAGGKKTTMYALADRIERAAVTATVRIPIFDRHVASVTVTDDPVATLDRVGAWPAGVVPERERDDRYLGYDPEVIDDVSAASIADAVLVKADGARMRLFKAPGEDEPRLPSSTDTVVPVASARVVGRPLTDEYVHRVERVSEFAGRDPGDSVRPTDVAAVLASGDGGRKGAPPGSTVVPLVNMVDDSSLERTAREIAAEILDRSDVPRVVLAQMTAEDPVVDVVEERS